MHASLQRITASDTSRAGARVLAGRLPRSPALTALTAMRRPARVSEPDDECQQRAGQRGIPADGYPEPLRVAVGIKDPGRATADDADIALLEDRIQQQPKPSNTSDRHRQHHCAHQPCLDGRVRTRGRRWRDSATLFHPDSRDVRGAQCTWGSASDASVDGCLCVLAAIRAATDLSLQRACTRCAAILMAQRTRPRAWNAPRCIRLKEDGLQHRDADVRTLP